MTLPNSDQIELLSPAGDFESLIAAVSNGTDAVYVGSKLFNARRLASNFDAEELKKAVQYCHIHGVKLYLTLNTLIKNHEIIPFLQQVAFAEQIGIDGILIQDLSFAPLIKQYFPKLSLHASTQATIMNTPAVEMWQKYLDVFVLARELTKDQIKTIYDKTKAHLEVFVHGHLCISYSGQCLISSLIGNRSGNRGMCASSCRKQYNGHNYLLSAKDLCMINTIQDVIDSGAKTIKIEGRMKSAEYVATITRSYRQQLNALQNGKNNPVSDKVWKDLKIVFNREFTPGYFNNEKSIVDSTTSSKRGIYVGTVINNKLRLLEDLEKHDGINIVCEGEKSGGHIRKILVNNVEVEKAVKGQQVTLPVAGFRNGAYVFLMSSLHGENLLGEKKLVPIDVSLTVVEGKSPIVILEAQGKKITITLKTPAAKPQKYPLTKKDLEKELRKFQSEIFYLDTITVDTDNSFIPKSELTALRSQLDQTMLDVLAPIKISDTKTEKIIPPIFTPQRAVDQKIHVRVYDLQGVNEALETGADFIYYDVFAADVEAARNLVKDRENNSRNSYSRNSSSSKFYVHTPMVLVDENIPKMIEIIEKIKPEGILANNVGVLGLNLKYPHILGYQMNIFNDNQLQYYSSLLNSKCQAIASLELTAKELNGFKNKKDLIYYAHGRPVVMTFKEHFDADKLKDKEGYTFKLRKVKIGGNDNENNNPNNVITEMLYSNSIGLLQRTNEITGVGISQLFLDLDSNVGEAVSTYKRLLNGEKMDVGRLKKEVTVANLMKGVM